MKEIEILRQVENPVMERTEVNFRVIHEDEATPKRDEIKELLAGMLKVNKKNIIVEKMSHEFGKQQTNGNARVYKNVETARKYERKHILKRNGALEENKPTKEEKE